MQPTDFQKEMHKIRTTVIRDMATLHPSCALAFRELAEYLKISFREGATHSDFGVFETYRHPLRQLYLLENDVTKAGLYKSAHQFGMAVDFVPHRKTATGTHWSWEQSEDWDFLKKSAAHFGLSVPIPWDRCHVQSSNWSEIVQLLP